MKAENINLKDFVYFGEGASGESYFHKDNQDIILKLALPSLPEKVIVSELELSQKVYSLGIPTPKPGKFVFDSESGRYGVIYERLRDKISYSRAIGNNPEKVEEYARGFAEACKKLHSVHIPAGLFPHVKQWDLEMLAENPFFTEKEKEKVAEFINDAPDGDTAIHGDLNFGNIVMCQGKDWFIDLGDFAYGHPLFDLGMVYLCSKISPEDFVREYYHMDKKTSGEFWHWFVCGYWGDDANQKEVEEMIRPYAGLKVLIIERNYKSHFPIFHALLDGITG